VPEICRKHGVSPWTFYRWQSKFAGMAVPEARKLRDLEEENRRLKRLLADQALDVQMLKEALAKKW
jgi:putative transposase